MHREQYWYEIHQGDEPRQLQENEHLLLRLEQPGLPDGHDGRGSWGWGQAYPWRPLEVGLGHHLREHLEPRSEEHEKTLLLPPANSAKQFWEGCTIVFKPYLVYLTTESKAQRKTCSQSDPLRVIAKITINCPLPPFPPTFREKGMQPMTTLSTE